MSVSTGISREGRAFQEAQKERSLAQKGMDTVYKGCIMGTAALYLVTKYFPGAVQGQCQSLATRSGLDPDRCHWLSDPGLETGMDAMILTGLTTYAAGTVWDWAKGAYNYCAGSKEGQADMEPQPYASSPLREPQPYASSPVRESQPYASSPLREPQPYYAPSSPREPQPYSSDDGIRQPRMYGQIEKRDMLYAYLGKEDPQKALVAFLESHQGQPKVIIQNIPNLFPYVDEAAGEKIRQSDNGKKALATSFFSALRAMGLTLSDQSVVQGTPNPSVSKTDILHMIVSTEMCGLGWAAGILVNYATSPSCPARVRVTMDEVIAQIQKCRQARGRIV